eukprot:COSAG06_NODE_21361_length_759_cov_2.050000_2_plen_70_part_01
MPSQEVSTRIFVEFSSGLATTATCFVAHRRPSVQMLSVAPIPNIRGTFSKVCPYLRRGIARVDLKRNKRI